jgi:hypothetical protein
MNPLLFAPVDIKKLGAKASWVLVVVAHDYKRWTATHTPIPDFHPHIEFRIPISTRLTYRQFLADFRVRVFLEQGAPVSLYTFSPVWGQLMPVLETSWDTLYNQVRDFVLSGGAMENGKLNHAAYFSWQVNFDELAQ